MSRNEEEDLRKTGVPIFKEYLDCVYEGFKFSFVGSTFSFDLADIYVVHTASEDAQSKFDDYVTGRKNYAKSRKAIVDKSSSFPQLEQTQNYVAFRDDTNLSKGNVVYLVVFRRGVVGVLFVAIMDLVNDKPPDGTVAGIIKQLVEKAQAAMFSSQPFKPGAEDIMIIDLIKPTIEQ